MEKIEKLGILDVDNSLAAGYYIWKFAVYLANEGYFDKRFLDKMDDNKRVYELEKREMDSLDYSKRWAKRTGPYLKFAENWVSNFGCGIKGKESEIIEKLGKKYIEIHGNEKFPFAGKLVEILKNEGFFTLALSASPIEIISPFCEDLGIQKAIATVYEKDAVSTSYTGEVEKSYAGKCSKSEVVTQFLIDNDQHMYERVLRKSFALGDSEHDVFLPFVANRVLIKKDEKSEEIAKMFECHLLDPHDNEFLPEAEKIIRS